MVYSYLIVTDVGCELNQCENGGSCEATGTENYKCRCLSGYAGEKCELCKFQKQGSYLRPPKHS